MTDTDFDALRLDQLSHIASVSAGLGGGDWDAASLCDSWRVQDVVAHMTLGYTAPMEVVGELIAAHGGDIEETSRLESVRFADEHGVDALLDLLDRVITERIREGISTQIPTPGLFYDHVVHLADMLVPLGRPTGTPEAAVAGAFALIPQMGGFVGADARAEGLRLHATDLDLRLGDGGPEVSGPAEALLLAVSGRPAGLDDLTGDGVAVLARRTNPPKER
jgi:uncharacterized protein (TIGR03083 family)